MREVSEYDKWHKNHEGEDDLNTIWYKFVTETIKWNEDIEQKEVMEIGCGRGGFAQFLLSHPRRPSVFVACDYSKSAVAIAEEKIGDIKGASFRVEDIQNLSFKESSFDTIVSCETIEHVPDPKKAIAELYRVLRSGGRLYLTCPNYFNLFGIWCFYRSIIGKPFTEGGQSYINYPWAPRILSWFKETGFKVEIFQAADIIIPARKPMHIYFEKCPGWLRLFGFRTFYVLKK